MSVIYATKNSIRLGRTGTTLHEIRVCEAANEEIKTLDLILNAETQVPSEYGCMESPKVASCMENKVHKIPAYSVKVLACGKYAGKNTAEIEWKI